VFQELITQSLLWSVVIVGVLSLLGGVIISQRMLRRVDELARTATIIQGDLGTRLPVQGIGDEFDRVAQNVNRMLDQIERLTSGMRTVIDSVAHDLRGPLTRIRGHIELALAGPADAAAYRQARHGARRERAAAPKRSMPCCRSPRPNPGPSGWRWSRSISRPSLAMCCWTSTSRSPRTRSLDRVPRQARGEPSETGSVHSVSMQPNQST
jgi:HAMP domain-containing protein